MNGLVKTISRCRPSLLSQSCDFHTSVVVNRFNLQQKQALLEKFFGVNRHLMSRSQLAKQHELEVPQEKKSKALRVRSAPNIVVPLSKRASMLREMYRQKLMEIFNHSTVAPLFSGYGLKIHDVKFSNGFFLDVFWTCANDSDIAEVNKILRKNTDLIHREMVRYHMIGRIPPITFTHVQKLMLVDRLLDVLKTVDFGEDRKFEFTENEDPILCIDGQLEANTWENIEGALKIDEEVEEEMQAEPPFMRSDVFGVQRDQIINQVKMRKVKSSTLEKFPSLEEVSEVPKVSTAPSRHNIRRWASIFRKKKSKIARRVQGGRLIYKLDLIREQDEHHFKYERLMPQFDDEEQER